MDLQQKLKEQGWHIASEGLDKLPSDVDKSDTRKVVQSLLNIDLRDVGAGALPAEIPRKDTIAGRVVLQVVKVRNISAPKSNEESKTAPRFLYLELTDGVTQIFALELEHIASISLNTPPGTKLYLRSERIGLMQGTLMLRPSDVQVLGGEVTALVEKWELTRTLQKYARGGRMNTGTSGPPPWIPFGQKIQQLNDDKNFKSLATGNNGADKEKEKDGKENEFDAMRNEAIAEAAKSGAKKVFGGGHQQMLDHNVKKIIEKGFSELDAKNALKTTRNNLERALYNLKRRDEGRERSDPRELVRVANKRGPFKEAKKGSVKEDPTALSAKPAGNVSLFDFLTDKLPTTTETSTATTTTATNAMSSTNRYEKSSSRYESLKSYGTSSNQPQSYNSGYQSHSSIPSNQQASAAASSSSHQQQHSNRSATKFENNISSSFANRNTTGNLPEGGEGNNYRNRPRNERGGGGSRGGYSAPFSSRHSSDVGRGGGGSSHGFISSHRNPFRASQERDRGANHHQSADANAAENQSEGHKAGNEYRSYKTERSSSTRYPNKPNYTNNSTQNNTNSNRNFAENRNSTHSDSDKIKELIDDTAKMKIEHKPIMRGGSSGRGQRGHSHYQPQPQPHHQKDAQQQQQQQQHVQIGSQSQIQHAQQQQQPQPIGVYAPLPNGFAYDPNKIRGFQNKESNEYALSLLKTQTIPPPLPQNAQPYPQPPPPPMQMPPPQTFHPGPPPFIMQAPHVRAFSIPTIDGSVFNWEAGDRCLAKYWDDRRFYEAEITGVSDKTCVVLFLGYGNYEEVLKSDCLPINNNPTIIAHQPTPIAAQPMQQSLHPVLAQPSVRTTATGTPSSGRYRGERQMYVPPPKREA